MNTQSHITRSYALGRKRGQAIAVRLGNLTDSQIAVVTILSYQYALEKHFWLNWHGYAVGFSSAYDRENYKQLQEGHNDLKSHR